MRFSTAENETLPRVNFGRWSDFETVRLKTAHNNRSQEACWTWAA